MARVARRETMDRDRTYHDVTKHTGIFCWQELDLREISTRVELSHRCGVTLIHSLHRFALKLDSSIKSFFSLFLFVRRRGRNSDNFPCDCRENGHVLFPPVLKSKCVKPFLAACSKWVDSRRCRFSRAIFVCQ